MTPAATPHGSKYAWLLFCRIPKCSLELTSLQPRQITRRAILYLTSSPVGLPRHKWQPIQSSHSIDDITWFCRRGLQHGRGCSEAVLQQRQAKGAERPHRCLQPIAPAVLPTHLPGREVPDQRSGSGTMHGAPPSGGCRLPARAPGGHRTGGGAGLWVRPDSIKTMFISVHKPAMQLLIPESPYASLFESSCRLNT